jgi:serine O-acetyltransferase
MPTTQSLIEQLQEDYRRHGGRTLNPAFWAVAVHRFGTWSSALDRGPMRKLASKTYGVLFHAVQLASGIVLNREAQLGQGFHLIHSGNTKIHPGVVIGERCGVMHDVTIGTNMNKEGVPQIGNDVFIGAGAKVLGPITIGDGACVAANSLVISDVPAGATAVGVPARIMQYPGRAAPAGATPVVRAANTLVVPPTNGVGWGLDGTHPSG